MERESDNQELSFFTCLDVEEDQKLGLIDVSQEDDDLLSDSPSFGSLADFRLSDVNQGCNLFKPQLFSKIDNNQGCNLFKPQLFSKIDNPGEKLLQKELELSPSRALMTEIPSYPRRSLAWDSAFFTNEGVLDDDELTMMNEGFKTAQMQTVTCKDVETQRFKLGYSTKDDPVSSVSKKVNPSIQNWKTKSASTRGSMNIQRSLKNKTQRLSKREEPHLLPLKAPKSSSLMTNLLSGKNRSASLDAYHIDKEDRAETMRSVDSLKLSKKPALEKKKPCRLSSAASPAEFVSPVFARSTKSSHDAAMRYLEKGEGPGHPSFSTQSLSLSCISPTTDTSSVASCSGSRSVASSPVEFSHQYNTPDVFHVSSESRKKLKPSYLRRPSPKIGFFDQKKSVTPTMGEGSQLLFETQGASPSENSHTNMTKPETMFLKLGSKNTQQLHPVQDIKPGNMRTDGQLRRYSQKVWSSAKTRPEVDLKSQSAACGEVGEWICSKCRKTGAGILDRKKVGKISALRQDEDKTGKGRLKSRLSREITATKLVKNSQKHKGSNLGPGNEEKVRMLGDFEEQVNDLSKYFEVIDLSEEMVMEKEEAPPRIFSNSGTEFSASPRTPLSDRTSMSNRSGSLKLSGKEKMAGSGYNPLMQSSGRDKENSFPYGA